jgi:hypothetical protein
MSNPKKDSSKSGLSQKLKKKLTSAIREATPKGPKSYAQQHKDNERIIVERVFGLNYESCPKTSAISVHYRSLTWSTYIDIHP